MGFMRDLGGAIGYAAGRAKGAINQAAIEGFEKENGRQIFFGGENTDPLLHKLIKEQPNNSWGQKFLDSDRANRHVREQKRQQKQPGTATQLVNRQRQRQEQAILNNQVAPGSASTQIKINSPTQAEQIAAGMASTKAPQRVSDTDRIKLGDKDMRSFLAEQKLRVANDLVGGEYSRDQLVDMLNQPGVQVGDQFAEAFAGDNVVQRAFQLGEEGQLMRPEFETSDFVGEGQFGRVRELAPGYVIKEQAPLVDFAGYRTDGEGNATSPRGKNLAPGGGSIRDYRDVADEVAQLKYLKNKGGITPGVEAFNINDDGSTEVIMRDLRENFEGADDYYDRLQNKFDDGDSKVQAQALKDSRMFEVKRRQQEAAAAIHGVELRDRHEGNVMRNKLTGRPLQIDPSGRQVEGVDRTNAIRNPVVDAFYKAGLTDEGQIFEGLLAEAVTNQDYDTYKDLVQQGASRVMKMKNVVDADEYTSLLGV